MYFTLEDFFFPYITYTCTYKDNMYLCIPTLSPNLWDFDSGHT